MTKTLEQIVAENFLLHASPTVTIMRPMPSVVARGKASSRDQQPTRSIRFEEDQLAAINEAAALLEMSRSAFIKWCAYYVAQDILKQHVEFEKRGM